MESLLREATHDKNNFVKFSIKYRGKYCFLTKLCSRVNIILEKIVILYIRI